MSKVDLHVIAISRMRGYANLLQCDEELETKRCVKFIRHGTVSDGSSFTKKDRQCVEVLVVTSNSVPP